MSAYPVMFEADFAEDRSRLSTFFRIVLAIPQMLWATVLGIAAFFTVIAAWFAVVITGRYPQGLYDFNAGLLRFSTRLNGYLSLLTDRWAPFGLGEVPDYPVRALIGPPKEQYSRVKALFRLVLLIPPLIVVYVLQLVWQLVLIVDWFAVVILGRQIRGLQAAMNMYFLYYVPFMAYALLLTEDWPPLGLIEPDVEPGGGLGPAGGGGGELLPPMPPEPTAPGATAPGATRSPEAPGMSSGDPLNPA
jgi:hypothetical protein